MSELMLTRNSAQLMLKIRNMVWEETGIKMGLSEAGTIDYFISICEKTERQDLRDAGVKLMEMVGESEPAKIETSQVKKRVYRGQVILEPEVEPASEDIQMEVNDGFPRKGKIITDRGQKMVV